MQHALSTPPRRMAATDRKHQLLEIALDVFSRQGFGGATTKEIAAAAGVAEAVIFRHFPTKLALYTEVLDYKLQSGALSPWLADIQACMDRDDDECLFRTILSHMLESFRAGARFERMILFAALEGHELALAHLRQHAQPFFESLHGYVRRRHAAGALHATKPQHILMALFGMVHHYGQMTQMFGFPRGGSDEEMADAFVRILMDGVRPRGENWDSPQSHRDVEKTADKHVEGTEMAEGTQKNSQNQRHEGPI